MKRLRRLDFSEPSTRSGSRPSGRSTRSTAIGLITGFLMVLVLTAGVGDTTFGKQVLVQFHYVTNTETAEPADTTSNEPRESLPADRVLRDLPAHPTNRLSPYLNPAASDSFVANPSVLRDFHDLLNQFAQRQQTDDNFTVRVMDRRSGEVLELYTLDERKTNYEQTPGPAEWRDVDDKRREVTRILVDKYERQGIPLEDIVVRWGRANQVRAAHERNQPYQAYEIQLAKYLGLSLLPTQMGTVETFNQDSLVSPAGAKSRYQMMPWILRRSGVNEYDLPANGNTSVHVEEALHPLLTMEPAFLLLRGYVNAVGHEIPGLSAYHTGPGNIFKLYRRYFTHSQYYEPSSTVVDAYIWALTKGFDSVREGTSFGPFSRGYIPSAYGALEARNDRPLDLSKTIRVARVQLKPGRQVSLKRVLASLDSTERSFDWGPGGDKSSMYARFRALNGHFDLPPTSDGSVPAAGNVQLVSSVDGKSVRFFLPLGAPEALRNRGLDALSPKLTFRFDQSTYAEPSDAQRTTWDEQYHELVEDIKFFGFTPENREELFFLHDKFEELAEQNPSRYRQRQLTIISTHRRIWLSNPWETLSGLTMRITPRGKPPIQPLVDIPIAQTDEARAASLSPFLQ